MIVSKQLVIFALVITLAYAKKKGKGSTTAAPPAPSTTHVPGQGGIEFLMKLYYRLDISLFKKGNFDHLIHCSKANEGPQDQATQYVPGQPGIELFVE